MILPALSPAYAANLGSSTYPNVVAPINEFGVFGTQEGKMLTSRGVTMDDNNYVYVSDCGNNRVQVFDVSGELIKTIGKYGQGNGEMICPTGLDISEGLLYVYDAGNHRVQIFNIDGNYSSQFGTFGHENGTFGTTNPNFTPQDLTVKNNRVYVSDTGNHKVEAFTTNGTNLFTIGSHGYGNGTFINPSGLVSDEEGNIYVSDMYNHRIQKFNSEGKFVKVFGLYGNYLGELAGPSGISYNNGKLYVVDTINHRVQVFGTDGSYLYQFGRHPIVPHEGNGRFHYPIAISTSNDGSLAVVCEKFESRCQVFDTNKIEKDYVNVEDTAWWDKYPWFHYRSGASIMDTDKMKIESPEKMIMTEDELHRVVIMNTSQVENSNNNTMIIGGFGPEPGKFNLPQGAHEDPWGNIWVSDTLNNRLQIFFSNGTLKEIIGTHGDGPGEFNEPGDLEIASNGDVYLVDTGNERVQVLDKDGNYLRSWGGYGNGTGEFNTPIGIGLNKNETKVYVAQLFDSKIQAFSTNGTFLNTWSKYGTAPGEVAAAHSIAVDSRGNIIVTDDALNRITKFDSDGKLLGIFGGLGTERGLFFHPTGIATDKDDRIWIMDTGNHRGQIFSNNGTFQKIFGVTVIGNTTLN